MEANQTDLRCDCGHQLVIVDLSLPKPGRPILACMHLGCAYYSLMVYAPKVKLEGVSIEELKKRGLR